TAVDVEGAYEGLAAAGYHYGPVFQGLRAAWRRGGELFAEVVLPEQAHADARRFGIHPALLDAAMHASLFTAGEPGAGRPATVLPFVWNQVSLHATGASVLRVRLTRPAAESLTLDIADDTGTPVLSVGSVVGRPVSAEQLAATGGESLFRIGWTPLAATPAGGELLLGDWTGRDEDVVPDVFVLSCRTPDTDLLPAVRAVSGDVLTAVRSWLADDRYDGTKLVVVTRDAVTPDGDLDLAQAPVWGLVRAAQAENPGRLFLVDADTTDLSGPITALVTAGEPEAAVRSGEILVPRLTRTPVEPAAAGFAAEGTVLVTGGTGGL
ncbi:polyketide synthase dehydratase domain-containing protein, partial [Amycolatopsis sp. SID8362]|uniref:polyketide synthase dehydratase domain-containing protein n=1 Tax=Amycolatopsis sp. SID8362 TaxID=2690346 RepID=UPI001368ED46